MQQLGTRLAIERARAETLRLRRGRNTELNKGCEVKRETLNLVVSPVRMGFGRAEALVMAAGNRGKDAKDECLPTAPGSQTASSSTW